MGRAWSKNDEIERKKQSVGIGFDLLMHPDLTARDACHNLGVGGCVRRGEEGGRFKG